MYHTRSESSALRAAENLKLSRAGIVGTSACAIEHGFRFGRPRARGITLLDGCGGLALARADLVLRLLERGACAFQPVLRRFGLADGTRGLEFAAAHPLFRLPNGAGRERGGLTRLRDARGIRRTS